MHLLNNILYVGYDPQWLLEKLHESLLCQEGFFRKLIIVPSKLIKERIYKRCLQESIAFGFKVLELPVAIDYLMRLITFEDQHSHAFPAASLLSLHLEKLLVELDSSKEEIMTPLKEYLSASDAKHRREKIQDLSDALSVEFLHYGLYGGKAFDPWLAKESWQVKLWKQVFSLWDYPYKIFKQGALLNPLSLQLEIHVFGFNFIPLIYEEFFHKLATSFHFYHYYLNPSLHFWGDICSEKERLFLNKKYQKKAVAPKQLAELDEYLKKRHGLLANFGKLSQKRLNRWLDQEIAMQEQEVDTLVAKEPPTLLHTMQQDLLEGKEEMAPHEGDLSLQLHEAPSKRREVEILLNNLKTLTDQEDILPSEILVLAPDISEYFPFIREIFQGSESPFSIAVHDLEILSQSHFLKGFWKILSLEDHRFEPQDLFEIFLIEPFLKRQKWSVEKIMQMKTWVEKAYITWGFDAEHRRRIVGRKAELSETGTWKYGLERILFGLVTAEECVELSEDLAHYYPLDVVEMKDAELLGDFIHLIESLYKEMSYYTQANLSLAGWVDYFKQLAEKYFLIDPEAVAEKEAWGFFVEQLKTLLQLSHKVGEALYPFSSMKRFFQKVFSKKGARFAEGSQEAICFASLKTEQIYPMKVVCLLGMEEGAFPRAFEPSPLRELEQQQMDPFPNTIEEDRQCLLDLFIYAEDYVIISYCALDGQDGQRQNVSFLIEECLEFVQKNYRISKNIRYVHRGFAFHHEEMQEPMINFSKRYYRLAKSLYAEQEPQESLIPEFYHLKEKEQPWERNLLEKKISLKELKRFAKNPLQHYLNDLLGVYLHKKTEESERLKREFIFSSLEKASFHKDHLREEFDLAYKKLELVGALPSGVFKEIAQDQLKEEQLTLSMNFQELGIDLAEGPMTIELSAACKTPLQKKEKYWLVPHLKIFLEGERSISIEGVLDNVFPQGLGFSGKDQIQDLVKIWPIYLVFHEVVSTYFSKDIQPELLLIKEGKKKAYHKEGVQSALKKYLLYYLKANNFPSPLLPPWTEALLSSSIDQIDKVIHQHFTPSSQQKVFDEYQKWTFDHLEPFCAKALHHVWDKDLNYTFQPFIQWCEKRGEYA